MVRTPHFPCRGHRFSDPTHGLGEAKKKKNQIGEVKLGPLLSVAPHLTNHGPLKEAFPGQKFQSLQFLGLCLSIHE